MRIPLLALIILVLQPGTNAQEKTTMASPLRSPEILVRNWDGNPLDLNPNRSLMATDVQMNPLFFAVSEVVPGRYRLELGNRQRFSLIALMDVPGFGRLKIVADAGGDGYLADEFRETPMNLNLELARSRALATLAAIGPAGTDPLPEPVRLREQKVRDGLAGLKAAGAEPPMATVAEILNEAMWFGEELIIAQARHRIVSSPKRSEFLFGANCFAADRGVPRYRELYADLLNFGTVPFYLGGYEPEEGKIQSGRVIGCLEFLEEHGLKAKGHPLIWLYRGCMPAWTDGRPYEEVREILRKRVERDVTAFRDRIKIWDVINEAHDWANCYGYNRDQLIELTRVAAEATRAADPEALRIVNCCCVFGEYAAAGQGHDKHPPGEVMTPYQYVERLFEEKVDFEVLGLQLYYTMFDLFEHKRLFDRFARFGLPIHVTEVAVPSSMEGDPNAHNKDPNAIKHLGIWRRPWDPETQAEWVQAFYTICYAHPAIEAVTWWDFSDATPHFFPRGGFQDENAEPKPSYFALQELLREWGFLENLSTPATE